MSSLKVKPLSQINKKLFIPGDKSISHRCVILGSLAHGVTHITNFLESEDCLNTIECFKKMGVKVERNFERNELTIHGRGLHGLEPPTETLYVGNSGTGIRLMLGILSAQRFDSVITGDDSICKRPMARVVSPLSLMGAQITPLNGSEKVLAPLKIRGNQRLSGITYEMPIASAQVKSAMMLAGLYAQGATVIVEPGPARDHTERMLRHFGVNVRVSGNRIEMQGGAELRAQQIYVPSDISSAAFFMVAGAIVHDSRIVMNAVGVNPTRTGIIDVLKMMGADIRISNLVNEEFEPVADIEVRTSSLKGVLLDGDIIPRIIDEIPIIAVAAAFAEGRTEIRGAQELRFKESDRIATVCFELKKFGVDIEELSDGLVINGKQPIHGAVCDSHGDHRIAMSSAILALMANDETVIHNTDCINTSFPEFFSLFDTIRF